MFSNFKKKYDIFCFLSWHKLAEFNLFLPYFKYIEYKNREYNKPIIYAIKFGLFFLKFQYDLYIKFVLKNKEGQNKQRF